MSRYNKGAKVKITLTNSAVITIPEAEILLESTNDCNILIAKYKNHTEKSPPNRARKELERKLKEKVKG